MRLGHEKQMHAIKRDETLRDEGVPATAVRIYHVSMYIPYVDSRMSSAQMFILMCDLVIIIYDRWVL